MPAEIVRFLRAIENIVRQHEGPSFAINGYELDAPCPPPVVEAPPMGSCTGFHLPYTIVSASKRLSHDAIEWIERSDEQAAAKFAAWRSEGFGIDCRDRILLASRTGSENSLTISHGAICRPSGDDRDLDLYEPPSMARLIAAEIPPHVGECIMGILDEIAPYWPISYFFAAASK